MTPLFSSQPGLSSQVFGGQAARGPTPILPGNGFLGQANPAYVDQWKQQWMKQYGTNDQDTSSSIQAIIQQHLAMRKKALMQAADPNVSASNDRQIQQD